MRVSAALSQSCQLDLGISAAQYQTSSTSRGFLLSIYAWPRSSDLLPWQCSNVRWTEAQDADLASRNRTHIERSSLFPSIACSFGMRMLKNAEYHANP